MPVALAGSVVAAEGRGRSLRREEEKLRWPRVKGNIGISIFLYRFCSKIRYNTFMGRD